jgi:hypothetical protein
MNTQQTKIQNLCKINADQYADEVYASGIAYAKHIAESDEEAISFLTKTREYWNWWKNQIDITNQYFIHTINLNLHATLRFQEWKSQHAPQSLNAYPGENVIEASYSVMIGKVVKVSR